MGAWIRCWVFGLLCATPTQDAEPKFLYDSPAGYQIEGLVVSSRGDHWAAVISGKEGERQVQKAVVDGSESDPFGLVALPAFSADGTHVAYAANGPQGTSVFLDGKAIAEGLSHHQSVNFRKDIPSVTPLMEFRSPTLTEGVALSADGKDVMWALTTIPGASVKDQRMSVFVSGQKVHEDGAIEWLGFTRDGWAVISSLPERKPYHQLARKGLPLFGFSSLYPDSIRGISKDPPVFPHSEGVWIGSQEYKFELILPQGSGATLPWRASIAWSGDGGAVARVQGEGTGAQRQYSVNVETSGKRTFSGPKHEWCAYPVLSRNGKKVAYRVRTKGRESVVVDGKEGPPCDQIGGLWIEPGGKSVAYVATLKAGAETKSFLIQEAKRHPVNGEVLEVYFSPAGTDAVALLSRGPHRSVLPLEALDRKADLEWDWASRPFFSADGATYSFLVRLGEKILRIERPVKAAKK